VIKSKRTARARDDGRQISRQVIENRDFIACCCSLSDMGNTHRHGVTLPRCYPKALTASEQWRRRGNGWGTRGPESSQTSRPQSKTGGDAPEIPIRARGVCTSSCSRLAEILRRALSLNGKPQNSHWAAPVADEPKGAKPRENIEEPKIGDALSLAGARKLAAVLQHQLTQGRDPGRPSAKTKRRAGSPPRILLRPSQRNI